MAASPSSRQSEVVLISLEKREWFADAYESHLSALQSTAQVHSLTKVDKIRSWLAKDPRASATAKLVATDGALARSKNSGCLGDVVRYIQAGGTIIFAFDFAHFITQEECKKLFRAFSLPWEIGIYEKSMFDVNRDMNHFNTSELVPRYNQKALHLKNVANSDAVYLPTMWSQRQAWVAATRPMSDQTHVPIAFARTGEGMVGYIGDVAMEGGTRDVLLAMCGLSKSCTDDQDDKSDEDYEDNPEDEEESDGDSEYTVIKSEEDVEDEVAELKKEEQGF